MAKTVWLNSRYFVGSRDLTGQASRCEVESTVEEKDVTNFGSGGAKEVIGGLESISISAAGAVDYGGQYDADLALWSARRVIEPHTWGPSNSGAAVAATAYLTRALRTSAKLLTSVGEVLPWELSASASYPLARGAFLYAPTSAVTSDGNGTAVQIGAVTAGRAMYATAHVLAASGSTPTLGITIESDDNAGFTSATTRLTFSQFTGTGSEIVRTDGSAITDTYWRAVIDVGGGTPSFTVAVAVGIGVFQ